MGKIGAPGQSCSADTPTPSSSPEAAESVPIRILSSVAQSPTPSAWKNPRDARIPGDPKRAGRNGSQPSDFVLYRDHLPRNPQGGSSMGGFT